MMEGKIVVKQEYFDSIKVAIDGLNIFFTSNFQEKNFAAEEDEEDTNLDRTIALIIDKIDNVSVDWINDPSLANQAVQKLNDSMVDSIDGSVPDNEELEDEFDKLCGYKSLQFIADNFQQFSALINGIYTMEIFTKPGNYKEAIDKFSTPLDLHEIADYVQDGSDKYKVFDVPTYVANLFANDDIEFPEGLEQQAEIDRINNGTESQLEIVVDDTAVTEEAAEINYFLETAPVHLKYNVNSDRFSVSTQMKTAITNFINGLKKCETTDDLLKFFSEEGTRKAGYPDKFSQVLIPCIVARVFDNKKKYPFEDYDKESLDKYTDSYRSIINKNKGAARFKNYDLFSVFKVDKEGTLQFLKDFLEVGIYNNKECSIPNNTIRTIFNIFDSRIYFDILYNIIPDDVKKEKFPTEDGFVKEVRGRINKNSRIANTYNDDENGEAVTTSEDMATNADKSSKEVKEYAENMISKFGEMSNTDIMYCEAYQDLIKMELSCAKDSLWNSDMEDVDQFIGESYDLFQERVKIDNGIFSKGSFAAEYIPFNDFGKPNYLTKEQLRDIINVNKKTIKEINSNSQDTGVIGKIFDPIDIKCAQDTIRLCEYWLKWYDSYYIKASTRDLKRDIDIADGDPTWSHTGDPNYKLLPNPKPSKEVRQEKMKALGKNFSRMSGKLISFFKLKPRTQKEVTEYAMYQESLLDNRGKGGIPGYIKDRIDLMDDGKYTKDPPEKVDTSDVDKETGYPTPANNPDDLADSIEAKLNSDADNLDKMLGVGWKEDPENAKTSPKVVVNITNNYNNSYNRTNQDMSSGKTVNDSRHYENSFNNGGSKEGHTNNYNNSSPSSDTKDSADKTSTGMSIHEMFMMLESEEPLSGNVDASPQKPKTDTMTAAMDLDRKTLPVQQKAKKAINKSISTAKAITKPLGRAGSWLNNIYDSLVKRSEDKVKAQIYEDHSYRNALRKASRIAIKIGAFGLFAQISGVLAAAYVGILALRHSDKQRLTKELQGDCAFEVGLIDTKLKDIEEDISKAEVRGDEKKVQELRASRNKLTRTRKELLNKIGNSVKAGLADKHIVNY